MAPAVSTTGSRFALLENSGKDDKGEKKSAKEKKEKKKKDKSETKAAEDEKDKHEDHRSRQERKKTDAEAFHTIIVARLACSFEQYSQKDCSDAAEWLGIDLDVEMLCSKAASAEASLGKLWPRMLKHMAAAVDEGLVPPSRTAELWELGPRLFDAAVVCSETPRLQAALERRFESDHALREEVQALEARRKHARPAGPAPEVLESRLSEQPLALFGRPPAFRADPARRPEAALMDEGRRSFAFRWPGLLKGEGGRRYFQVLRESTPWGELLRPDGTTKRSTCWYARGGCRCDYTYGSERVRVQTAEIDDGRFQRIMEDLTENTFRLARPDWPREDWPNSANLNLYADGSQAVGWHADDESLFSGKEEDCLIVSLSLGAAREFWLAPRGASVGETARPDASAITWMSLEDGDLLTMEGLCQKHYLHCVPSARSSGPRINVTWRWIKQHKPHCPIGHGDAGKHGAAAS